MTHVLHNPKGQSYTPTEQSERLYQEALEAIRAVFSDDSIVLGVTRAQLNELKGEINIFLEALDNDETDIRLDIDDLEDD